MYNIGMGRVTKPKGSKAKGSPKRKPAGGTTARMGFLVDGVALFCPRIRKWVIRLDDDSGFSALGYESALRQFRGRRVQFWVRP